MTTTAETGLNPLIHVPARLRIMATLAACPRDGMLEFKRLRTLLDLTDGNLGSHLVTLEAAGVVTILKDHEGKRPRTRVFATAQGRTAFAAHVAALRAILDSAPSSGRAEAAE